MTVDTKASELLISLRKTIVQYNEGMRGLILVALALTLGYSQCVAACALEFDHISQAPPATEHCHHQDSGKPQTGDTCTHHGVIEFQNAAARVIPMAVPVSDYGLEPLMFASVAVENFLETPASPPGGQAPIISLRI